MGTTTPVTEGTELAPVAHEITQEAVSAYAEASGDFNPIHIDPEFAAQSHFGRRIAHGMMIAASVSELMSDAFGLDWARSGRMKIRFRAPVFPGDRIETGGTVKSVESLEDGSSRVTCTVVTVRRGEDGATEETAITAQASVLATTTGLD